MSADGARSQLAERLRTCRRSANLRGTELAALMGVSQGWVSKVENNKSRISPEQAEEWALHTHASVETRAELVGLAERADNEITAWKELYAQGWATHQKRYEELEQGAAVVKIYSVAMIPGVMQTAGYTAHVLGNVLGLPAESVLAGIAGRQARHELLYRPSSRFEVVLAEQVIRHRLGGPGVLLEQLNRLVAVAKLPTVDLRIIPINTSMNVPYGTGFDLFEFPGEGESVSVIELAGSERKDMEPEILDKIRGRFELYRGAALAGDAAVAMIEAIADEVAAGISRERSGE